MITKFNLGKVFSMKESKEIEKILLDDAAYNKLLKSKIEMEFTNELTNAELEKNKKEITDIKKAPKDKLFTKDAVFEIINKNSRTKSYINGVQAEGFLGTSYADRENLLSGISESFVSGNNYVKFVKIKV